MAQRVQAPKSDATLTVALVSEVFFDSDGEKRLRNALREAKSMGAQLAVLPELPLNEWAPARLEPSMQEAEPPKGKRHQMQAAAAEAVGIGLIGGAIVREHGTGRRYNSALVFDRTGAHLGTYCKCHLPDERGFREMSHFTPGDDPSEIFDSFGLRIGLQICSDINRPQGALALAAAGAEAIINPRASELATADRWRIVLQAVAILAAAYVISVNRPRAEGDAKIGGPSIIADPTGRVILDTTDPIAVATIDRRAVLEARTTYPGNLPIRSDLYARAWSKIRPDPTRTS